MSSIVVFKADLHLQVKVTLIPLPTIKASFTQAPLLNGIRSFSKDLSTDPH